MRVNPQTQQIVQRRINKKNGDESSSQKTSAQTEKEGQNNSLAQSRGLQYVENLQSGRKKSSVSSNMYSQSYNNVNSPQIHYSYQQKRIPSTQTLSTKNSSTQASTASENITSTEPLLSATRSPKVNIAQIMGDFKNTALAIGTPEETLSEVSDYLHLVDKQVRKEEPNVKLVQTNLRSAAVLLDSYISDTLNKDSKVVENWVEAVFLQQVNYNYDNSVVNKDFLVNVPEKKKTEETNSETQVQTENVATNEIKSEKSVDQILKNLFKQAKSLKKEDNTDEAINVINLGLTRADKVEETDIKSKLYYELGSIYDENNDLNKALSNYNNAIKIADDTNIKIKSHYAMGQIYDDIKKYKPAVEHYVSAVSYAGETGNLTAQTQALTKIANIYADEYDKKAFDIYSDAETIAKETKNPKIKGYVSSNIANAYNKFNQPTEALKYYSEAIKNYKEIESPEKVATNYKKAAELMYDFQNYDKSKALLQKAMSYAVQSDDKNLVKEINKSLSKL